MEPSGCGDELVQGASGEEAYIESPNYPQPYPSNLACSWLITAPEGQAVELRFESPFHLEVVMLEPLSPRQATQPVTTV